MRQTGLICKHTSWLYLNLVNTWIKSLIWSHLARWDIFIIVFWRYIMSMVSYDIKSYGPYTLVSWCLHFKATHFRICIDWFVMQCYKLYMLTCKLDITICTTIYSIGRSMTWNVHSACSASTWMIAYQQVNGCHTAWLLLLKTYQSLLSMIFTRAVYLFLRISQYLHCTQYFHNMQIAFPYWRRIAATQTVWKL